MAFNLLQASLSMKAVGETAIEPVVMDSLASRIKYIRKAHKLSQEAFAARLGEVNGMRITRGAVGNWETGGGISRENLAAIAEIFHCPLDWLTLGRGAPPALEATPGMRLTNDYVPVAGTEKTPAKVPSENNARLGGSIDGFTKIPVRGQGMGGKYGALLFDFHQDMGEVQAPPSLHGVPGAYAVYVVGDSMLERFRDGEVVFVHPHLVVRKDDDCVIQIANPDGSVTGWVKRYVSRDEKSLKVRQLNPKKVITFPASSVVSVHRIIMSGPA